MLVSAFSSLIWNLRAIHLENHLVSLFVGGDDVLDWLRLCQRGFKFLKISLVCFWALQSVWKYGTFLIISKCRKNYYIDALYIHFWYKMVYWVTIFLLNCLLVALNLAELSQALAESYAWWYCSSWTVYWLSWILLKCHRL